MGDFPEAVVFAEQDTDDDRYSAPKIYPSPVCALIDNEKTYPTSDDKKKIENMITVVAYIK